MAVRATRPRSAVISLRARPSAKLSRSWPPAYMSATTLPASSSPKARAAVIDSAATTSSPTSPRRRLRTICTKRPASTGRVPAAQAHDAQGAPSAQAIPPTARPATATATRPACRGSLIHRPATIAPLQLSLRRPSTDGHAKSGEREVHPDEAVGGGGGRRLGQRRAGRRPEHPGRGDGELGRGQDVVDAQVARPGVVAPVGGVEFGRAGVAGVGRGFGAAARRARVLQAGVGEEGGDAVAQPGAVEGIGVEVAEDETGPSGSAAVRPASSRNGRAVEVVGPEADLVVVAPPVEALRRRRRAAASGWRRGGAAGGRPAASTGTSQCEREERRSRGRAAASGKGLPSGRSGSSAPGRSLQGRRRKLRAASASMGRRERSAMPPWPGNLPQPKPSPQPAGRPSPSRSRPEGSPAFTWAWKACG